jgi:hypothetical protein
MTLLLLRKTPLRKKPLSSKKLPSQRRLLAKRKLPPRTKSYPPLLQPLPNLLRTQTSL